MADRPTQPTASALRGESLPSSTAMLNDRLPTLAELRARREAAMLRANRRILPILMWGSAPTIAAGILVLLVVTHRIDGANLLPFVLGGGFLGAVSVAVAVFFYVRHYLPQEMAKEGLLCHACGKPLILRPTEANGGHHRAEIKDPDILAAMDGKCGACGVWVVRDRLGLPAGRDAASPALPAVLHDRPSNTRAGAGRRVANDSPEER